MPGNSEIEMAVLSMVNFGQIVVELIRAPSSLLWVARHVANLQL